MRQMKVHTHMCGTCSVYVQCVYREECSCTLWRGCSKGVRGSAVSPSFVALCVTTLSGVCQTVWGGQLLRGPITIAKNAAFVHLLDGQTIHIEERSRHGRHANSAARIMSSYAIIMYQIRSSYVSGVRPTRSIHCGQNIAT